jgi:hypothetical protein
MIIMPIDLTKFETTFTKTDPELVSLTKKSGISLAKKSLTGVTSKVAICLDVSYSMQQLYKSGAISELVKKLIPLGINFDDDGEIDVFSFSKEGETLESINLNNYESRLNELKDIKLGGYTNYAKAINLVKDHYSAEPDAKDVPVYVAFITDGDATDKAEATKAITEISNLPIFFQFIGLGEDYNPIEEAKAPVTQEEPKKGFFGRLFGGDTNTSNPQPRLFKFLLQLDNLSGRKVDNAGFFAVKNPTMLDPDHLYDLMFHEYPSFLKEARGEHILR